MNTYKNILLHLSLIDGIGPGIIQKIIERKPNDLSWQDLYTFSKADWMQLFIQETTAQKIVSGLEADCFAQEQALLEKHQFNWTTILDPDYPELLKHIHLPPPVLYWRGTLPSENIKTIAIVGARKADKYGQHAIDLIVPTLVRHGITIVSGGALGADSMAHRATVDAGGNTIAVLGSGLLCPYPQENKRLFDRIIEQGGVVLSAFPLRTTPYPGNFPARNRIIAGLSLGVLVVQAARKSGARITAQFALEQGREVFAIPGPIDNELSDGCHALVQEGAKLITGPEDVLQEIGIEFESSDTKMAHVSEGRRDGALKLDDPVQECIMRACVRSQSIDGLADQLELSLAELQTHLFDLQVSGLIEQDFTGRWKQVYV
jgi:DNA processing protein